MAEYALYDLDTLPPAAGLAGQRILNYIDSDRLNEVVFAEQPHTSSAPIYVEDALPTPERSFWKEVVAPRLGALATILRPLPGSPRQTSMPGQQER